MFYPLRFIFVFSVLLFVSNLSFGQKDQIDSLTQLLNIQKEQDTIRVMHLQRLSRLYRNRNLDSAVIIGHQSLDLSRRLNYKRGESGACNEIGSALRYSGDLGESEKYFSIAIGIGNELKDQNAEAGYRKNLAGVFAAMGELEKATEELERVKGIFYELKDTLRVASVLNDLGRNYIRMYAFNKAQNRLITGLKIAGAIKHEVLKGAVLTNLAVLLLNIESYDYALMAAKESYTIFQNEGFTIYAGASKSIIANIYVKLDEHAEAIEHLEKSVAIAESVGDNSGLIIRSNNLGVIYYDLERYDEAFVQFQRSLQLSKKMSYTDDFARGMGNLGWIYLDKEKPDSAVFYGLKSLEIYEALGKPSRVSTYELLALAYAKKGDYENAYSCENEVKSMKDSLNILEETNIVKEFEVKYETEKKNRELQEMTFNNEKSEKAVLDFKLIVAGLSIFLLCFLTIVILYIRSKKIRQREQTLDLEQQALRAQMNPHFIFNSLNSIQRLYLENEFDKAADYMADFSILLRAILENSSKTRITVREELKYLDLYCKMEMLRTDGAMEYEIQVDSAINQGDNRIPPMIIQPFVENAIWHGILPSKRNGKVIIELLSEKNRSLRINVKDNGIGWQKETTTHESRGIELIERRINAKVRIETLNPGTLISYNLQML